MIPQQLSIYKRFNPILSKHTSLSSKNAKKVTGNRRWRSRMFSSRDARRSSRDEMLRRCHANYPAPAAGSPWDWELLSYSSMRAFIYICLLAGKSPPNFGEQMPKCMVLSGEKVDVCDRVEHNLLCCLPL